MTSHVRVRRSVLPAALAAVLPLALAAPQAVAGGGAQSPGTSGTASPGGATWGADQPRFSAPGSTSGDTTTQSLAPATAAPDGSTGGSSSAPASWVIRGAGFGHGVGMSQYGAWAMAQAGKTAPQILAHYYQGTTYDAVNDTTQIAVNLEHQTSSVALSSTDTSGAGAGSFFVTVGSTTLTGDGGAGETATVTRSGSTVAVSCPGCSGATSASGTSASVTFTDGDLLQVDGDGYDHGVLTITPSPSPSDSTLEAVLHLRLHDEYLDHVEEMPWSWSSEALKAQAAASRAYALRKRGAGLRPSCACNVYDSTADQVFAPYPTDLVGYYWDRWKSAVRATGSASTGYVPRYDGKVIEAVYSSSNGGWTESNEDVWGTTPVPYLRSVKDSWSLTSDNPRASWKTTVSQSALASAFGLSDVVRLDLRDRTVAYAVGTATATSSSGATATITGQQLVARLGLSSAWVRHLTARKSGSNRYATATAVARSISSTATTAVLASGQNAHLPDASVSSPLARAVGGPLLLTKDDVLPSPTVTELDRRAGSLRTVYIVGGTSAISSGIATQLRDRGLTVQRFSGRNRYATAAVVAEKVAALHSVDTVVVAGGNGLPDALAASGPAAYRGQPILLTPVDRIASPTASALDQIQPSAATIVGGTSVVGSAVTDALKARSITTLRLSGSSRYGTAAAVATHYRGTVPTGRVLLTAGADGSMADSLVAGSLGRLIVLTKSTVVPSVTATFLQGTAALDTVLAVGGTAPVPAAVLREAANT